MSIRTERIAEQIKKEVSVILRDQISDPRVQLLSITRIKLSKDLSHAILFWSPLTADGDDVDEMGAGLDSASGFVRKQLAKGLNLRRTPALDFRFDPSIDEGSRMLSLIRKVNDDIGTEADDTSGDSDGEGEDGAAT